MDRPLASLRYLDQRSGTCSTSATASLGAVSFPCGSVTVNRGSQIIHESRSARLIVLYFFFSDHFAGVLHCPERRLEQAVASLPEMYKTAGCLLLLLAATGASAFEWKTCGDGLMTVNDVQLTPEPIAPGETASFTISVSAGDRGASRVDCSG